MTRPTYIPNWSPLSIEDFDCIPWLSLTEARQECFMALTTISYTYGRPPRDRTYTSIPLDPLVEGLLEFLNREGYSFNGCFLNRYLSHRNHLGWHADDFPGMDQEHPIAVISFGESREIWWKRIGEKGVIPEENKQLLEPGSLFIMPKGFQNTHLHKIPKGDREMGPRVSLTFRRFL